MDFRSGQRFIGCVDADEVLNQPGIGLAVQSLRIAPSALLDGRIDEHFKERARRQLLACRVPLRAIRRDVGMV
jgi:hypothetical protein